MFETLSTSNNEKSNVSSDTFKLTNKNSYVHIIKRKAIRLVLAIILLFFIQWTPLWLFQTVITYNDTHFDLDVLHLTNMFVSILSYSNAVANPTLYMLVTYNFKEFYVRVFRKKSITIVRRRYALANVKEPEENSSKESKSTQTRIPRTRRH